MKSLVINTITLLALVAFTLTFSSCGGDDDTNCVTCVLAGVDDTEICDEGGIGSGAIFDTAVAAQEALGADCN